MKDNDTPAFPIVHGHFVESLGMTLRDYFAGQALIAIVNKSLGVERIDAKFMAGVSYEIADAMLEVRK